MGWRSRLCAVGRSDQTRNVLISYSSDVSASGPASVMGVRMFTWPPCRPIVHLDGLGAPRSGSRANRKLASKEEDLVPRPNRRPFPSAARKRTSRNTPLDKFPQSRWCRVEAIRRADRRTSRGEPLRRPAEREPALPANPRLLPFRPGSHRASRTAGMLPATRLLFFAFTAKLLNTVQTQRGEQVCLAFVPRSKRVEG